MRTTPYYSTRRGARIGLGAIFLLASVFFVFAMLLGRLVTPTKAQVVQPPICDTRETIINLLTGARYEEAQRALGVVSDHSIMEVYATPDGSTWSVVVSHKNGRTCLIAAGQSLQVMELVEGEPS